MVTEDHNKWMSKGVALTPDGSVNVGEYDGYGNLCSYDYNDDGEAEMYHHDCWKLAGKPSEFTEISEDARDQGCFFDDNTHNVHEPKDEKDLHNIKIAGVLAEKACCLSWREAHLSYLIDVAWGLIINETEDPEEKERAMEQLQRHLMKEKEKEEKIKKEEKEKEAKEKQKEIDELREYYESNGGFDCEECGEFFLVEERGDFKSEMLWVCKECVKKMDL